jgi:hypothetical protein
VPDPTRTIDRDGVRSAISAIRDAAATLHRPKYLRAGLTLARLRERGQLPQWQSVQYWPAPRGGAINRQSQMTALGELLGAPAGALLDLTNRDGSQVHALLGHPERVLIDVFADARSRRSEIQIVAQTGVSTTDRGVWLAINSPALSFADATAAPAALPTRSSEYNPGNEFRQQQGLNCAYLLRELHAMGPEAAGARLAQSRRACPYLGQQHKGGGRRVPVCRLNAIGCNQKSAGVLGTGEIEWGVGGPKLLLEDAELQRLTAIPRDGEDLPVLTADRPEGQRGLILAPGWELILREWIVGGRAGAALPSAADLATLRAWLERQSDAPTARLRDVADLIGEDTMLALLA